MSVTFAFDLKNKRFDGVGDGNTLLRIRSLTSQNGDGPNIAGGTSTAQQVRVSSESVVVRQRVGVPVGVVVTGDGRVDDQLGGGGTGTSQGDDSHQEEYLRKQLTRVHNTVDL